MWSAEVVSFFCAFFFFRAEDGIRGAHVTGVQTCALPISVVAWWLPRNGDPRVITDLTSSGNARATSDRKSVVEGKSVDLGGRRITKKKKLGAGLVTGQYPPRARRFRVGAYRYGLA